jgi:hypothetical protein
LCRRATAGPCSIARDRGSGRSGSSPSGLVDVSQPSARITAAIRPGSLPRDVALFGGVVLGATAVLIAILVWCGIAWHAMPSKYFRERTAGTYYSGALLVTAGALAAGVARRAGLASFSRFWAVAAAGFVYLGLDDVLRIHEELDRSIHGLLGWDPKHWLTDHLDDAIVVFYGLVASAWAYYHRDALLRLRWTALGLAIAFVGFAAMSVLDVLGGFPTTEESLKLLAEAMIVTAIFAAYRDPALAGPTT